MSLRIPPGRRTSSFVAIVAVAIALTAPVEAGLVTFDGLVHGEVVTSQYQLSDGLEISVTNPNRSHDLAAAFDTARSGTSDPDLQGPPWSVGNLAPGTSLGSILIIAENDLDVEPPFGVLDDPDDEGARPAGTFILRFDAAITSFGFDIIDVEWATEEPGGVTLFDGDVQVGQVTFADLVTPSSPFYDPTIVFGNNSANRIAPLTAESLASLRFDRVEIAMGGSGGIDNLTFTAVPAPPAAALLALAAIGRRRRRIA